MRGAWAVLCGVVTALSAGAALAANVPRDQIAKLVEKEYPSLEQIYLHIHTHPELSLREEKTAIKLAGELRAAGYEVTEHVGGYGVVAVLRNGPGKTLLIRTDLDALPVREETGAEYASKATMEDAFGKTAPVMHACGHDVHITCIVGVARTMAAMKDRWRGTLVLIGQPAEEMVKGAAAMLRDGLFEKFPRPDWCLAQHVDSELAIGQIGYVSGYMMANVDSVDVVIRGVGGHGAMPHATKDPVVIAAQTVLALQTIASREVKATEPVVVTVGSIHGGTKRNVIPDEVTLQLTVRTYSEAVRQQVLKAIERIAKGIAMAAGVPKELEPVVTLQDESTPATYNTPELVERVLPALRAAVGDQNVIKREPSMGAEDFGLYGRQDPKIPIFMFRLGSVAPEKVAESKREGGKRLPSLHSSKYLPVREPTIKTGVLAMTAAAIDLLASGAQSPKSSADEPDRGTPRSEKPAYPTLGHVERLDPKLDELIAPDAKIERLAAGFMWAEGPVWVPQGGFLAFSDVKRNIAFKWKDGEGLSEFVNPSGYTGSTPRGGEPGSNGLTVDRQGRLVLCEHGDRRVARLEKDGKTKTTLADRYEGKRFNSPNDLCFKSNGDLYFTDPPYGLVGDVNDPNNPTKELPFQGVYRISKDGKVTLLTKDMTRPNGLAFSPDEKTLYIANSDPRHAVWMAFDVKDDGTIANGRVFFDATELVKSGKQGLPDGMKIDRHGNLFASGPGGILILTPDARHLGTIITGEKTANSAWGGDGSVLYMCADMYVCRIQTRTSGKMPGNGAR